MLHPSLSASEAELSAIFRNAHAVVESPSDRLARSDGAVREMADTLSVDSTHIPHSPRRVASFPASSLYLQNDELTTNTNVQTNTKQDDYVSLLEENEVFENGTTLERSSPVDDRMASLEAQVAEQRDEIVVLKSALANALRRLSSLEEAGKKSRGGRMMPTIPSNTGQPSASVRPSRLSLPGPSQRKMTTEKSDVENDASNIVKGLLRTMRSKSPTRSVETNNNNNLLAPTMRKNSFRNESEEPVNGTAPSPDSRRSSSFGENEVKQDSLVSSYSEGRKTNVVLTPKDTEKQDDKPVRTSSPKLNGHQTETVTENIVNGRPVSPSMETQEDTAARIRKNSYTISKAEDIENLKNLTTKEKPVRSVSPQASETGRDSPSLENRNGVSGRTSPPEEESQTASPRSRATLTASRVRVTSGNGLKGKKNRWRSETDLLSRTRSKTVGGQPASDIKSASQTSLKKRASTGSSGLRRTASVSSLNTGKEDPSKSTKDEATKLYIRGRSLNLYPPSDFVESRSVGQPPNEKLTLEWVYGYRGRDCRNNLFYLSSGELVYNMAAVVILYDETKGTQRHYLGHNDDVKCVAVHPNKQYVASGQVAGHDKEEGKPQVRIWDSITLETLQVLGIGHFERAISCLAFSIKDEGRHLIVVDEANEHVISLWEWEKNQKITENKGASDPVLAITYHPRDSSFIVSCGKSHIAFWTVLERGGLVKKMGVFGKFDKPRFVLSLCFLTNGDLLSGDSNGSIYIWAQGTNNINKAIVGAHEGPVFSLCALEDGKFLSGGGRDRLVVLWDTSYEPLREIQLEESVGPVRAIISGAVLDDGTPHIAIGTTKNSLLHGTFDQGIEPIIKGHTDELWGLGVHPSQRLFATGGYDKQILMWNADTHSVIWHKQVEETLQSAAFHPKAFVLAIGTQSGNWMVLDAIKGDQLAAFHDGPEQLDAIKYSPDGKMIAVGSHDNFIYLYTVSEDGRNYKRHGKLSGHSSFVTHVDWSRDSQYLQSNSGDYELLYWNAARCKQVVSTYSMRDIQWETWTCVLGFSVCGIWPEGADGTDINACARSNKSQLLVTGDDFGQVNFFRYPSSRLKSDCQNCTGHSSHVTCVRFLHDDTRVISTGGKDCSVMQWRVDTE